MAPSLQPVRLKALPPFIMSLIRVAPRRSASRAALRTSGTPSATVEKYRAPSPHAQIAVSDS